MTHNMARESELRFKYTVEYVTELTSGVIGVDLGGLRQFSRLCNQIPIT